jgi:hypothetical protein
MKSHRARVVGVCATVLMLPLIGWAQHGDLTHEQPATTDAVVDFGVLPNGPIGSAQQGCLQSGAIGGPADPCSYKLHHLTPEEVTIQKAGQVTFQIHGGGHAFAIYEVSKNTTRDELGQFLCPGNDPGTAPTSADHPCNLSVPNANAIHNIADGKGDVVIVASTGGGTHPANRVWYEPGRLMSAGGQQFLNGGANAVVGPPAVAAQPGQLLTYRFLKTGRYLVICMNRVHFLNDWMFGFVNVVGE